MAIDLKRSNFNGVNEEFYEKEKDTAVNMIALSYIRLIHEHNLISDKEYNYILDKYGQLNNRT